MSNRKCCWFPSNKSIRTIIQGDKVNIFNSVFSGSGQVTVNGKVYEGTNICIQNDKVIIDGVVQDDKSLVGANYNQHKWSRRNH